jgi:hypothetical protein
MSSETKEVAVKKEETTAVATRAPVQASRSQALASDRIIPRILLMQGLSDFVTQRKATMGDFVRTSNLEKLGDPETPFDFIVLSEPIGSWRVEKEVNGKFRFQSAEPRNAKNDNLPWTFFRTPDGVDCMPTDKGAVKWRRVKCLTCFVILPSDIEAHFAELEKVKKGEFPDLNKSLTPMVMDFRSTNINAGKEIVSLFDAARGYGLDGSNYVISMGCTMESNDSGTFYNFKVDRSKPKQVKAEHQEEVAKWRDIVRSTDLRVDEEPEETESAGGTAAASSVC